jgi:hypothetical protein
MMNVTVPLLSPQILYIMITSFIASFKEYTSVVGLFGSPSTDGGGTKNMYTIVYYIYDQIKGNVGYGGAAAVLLFIVIMIFTAIQFQVSQEEGLLLIMENAKKEKSVDTRNFIQKLFVDEDRPRKAGGTGSQPRIPGDRYLKDVLVIKEGRANVGSARKGPKGRPDRRNRHYVCLLAFHVPHRPLPVLLDDYHFAQIHD